MRAVEGSRGRTAISPQAKEDTVTPVVQELSDYAAKMEGRWYKKYIWGCEESFQKIFVERTIF